MGCPKVLSITAVFMGIVALSSAMCCCPATMPVERPPCPAPLDATPGASDASCADAAAAPVAEAGDAEDTESAYEVRLEKCLPPKVWAWSCVTKPAPTCPKDFACDADQVCLEGACKYTCETDLDCRRIDARIGYCGADHVCRSAPTKATAAAR